MEEAIAREILITWVSSEIEADKAEEASPKVFIRLLNLERPTPGMFKRQIESFNLSLSSLLVKMSLYFSK